jgi:hypothetical protein
MIAAITAVQGVIIGVAIAVIVFTGLAGIAIVVNTREETDFDSDNESEKDIRKPYSLRDNCEFTGDCDGHCDKCMFGGAAPSSTGSETGDRRQKLDFV